MSTNNEREYEIRWDMGGIMASSPEEAARKARMIQLDAGSEATVFDVRTGATGWERVDLDEIDALVECEECGEEVPSTGDTMSDAHAESCSLHPSALLPEVKSIGQVADMIDPRKAQLAVAGILQALGAAYEWDSETVEWAAGFAMDAAKGTQIPSCSDQDDAALAFWKRLEE